MALVETAEEELKRRSFEGLGPIWTRGASVSHRDSGKLDDHILLRVSLLTVHYQ